MKRKEKSKSGKNKLGVIGFLVCVVSVFSILLDAFGVFAIIGLVISIVGLIESIRDKNELFYPIAGIVLGCLFGLRLIFTALLYLCSSYNTLIGILLTISLVLGLCSLGYALYIRRNNKDKTKNFIISLILGIVLIIVFGLSFLSVSDTENRLEYKLKGYAKVYFGTKEWMNGDVKPDTYTITLEDLSKRLRQDITLFEKYNCDKKNTKVEFVVKPPVVKGKTNYTYVITLDCD